MTALLSAAVAITIFNALATADEAQAGAAECANISPIAQTQCIGRRVEAKDRLVERLYLPALAAVRAGFAKWGRHDSRLDPRHFAEAHRDWRRFVASDCRARGAIGGGSNGAISDRITRCYERELDERIQLYRQIAEGTYGL